MNDLVICLIVIALIVAGSLIGAPMGLRQPRLPQPLAVGMRKITGNLSAHTPLSLMRRRILREATDREICEAISFLRNLIAADRGGRVSADSLLEQLAERDGPLRPAFTKALSLLRVDRKDEMIRYFSEAGGTTMSRDFIRMIVGWDNVSPDKLSSTLLSYQNTMKEIRTTELKRRNEMLSDLVFFPVVANVLAVFMNFIFIAYFIGQQDMLRQMFL